MIYLSGYDLVLEVSEDFLNRSLESLYGERVITRKYNGEHRLDIPLIPKEYQKTKFEIDFKEALKVDALINDRISVKFSAGVKIELGLLKIESEVKGIVLCKPVYNRALFQLELNIVEVELEKIKVLGFLTLLGFLVKSVNEIITEVISEELTNMDNIPVSPIIGNLELPEMPKGNKYLLPVGFGDVKIIDEHTVVVGFDIAFDGEGAKTSITKSKFDGDIVVNISKSAINKVTNFWWKHTSYPKTMPFKGKTPINNVEKLIDYLSNYSVELIPKLFTLGFIEIDWGLIELWLDYEGVVSISKPNVTFDEDSLSIEAASIIDITAFLRTELDVSVEFDTSGPIPDALMPWKDDKKIGSDRRVFEAMRYRANRKHIQFVDPDARLLLDEEQRIVLDFGGFDLDLGLNWRLPRRIVRRMESNIEKHIKAEFPQIPLSPSIIKHRIEETDLLMELNVKEIKHRKNALQVKANIEYKKD